MAMKKNNLLLISAVSGLAVLAACSGQEEVSEDEQAVSGEEAGSEGGELLLAMPSDAVTLDPHRSNDIPSNIVSTNLYERLIETDEDMNFIPGLANSYEQIDETTWEFELQEGVEFHDGEPFNADAVEANIDRLLNPDIASPRAFLYDMITEVEIIDDHTVRIHTEYPFGPLLHHLSHDGASMISPKAIEEGYDNERNLDVEPAGTGAFTFESWDQGNEVILTRNENYWREQPDLNSVTFRVIPEQLTRIGMLENNEAHVAASIEPVNTTAVESMPNADLQIQDGLRVDYIGFNTQSEPFDDVRVRQAITHAINTEDIITGLYEGYGMHAKGPVSPLVFGFAEGAEPLDYDVEQAKELLAEAGYEDGFQTTITTNEENPIRNQIAALVQDRLSEIGIDVEIQSLEWGTFLDATSEGTYDIQLSGWTTATGDADYGIYSLYHTDNLGSAGNTSFYENEELDTLIENARQETDETVRQELYEDITQQLIDEAPHIYTVHEQHLTGVNESIEGLIQHPNGTFIFDEVRVLDAVEEDESY
ncbi:hypothetical protein DH09_05810 [Bacillaceae bacterium JMAK1]|nr:hypothetical protein DH09_05810 [Bacillaceae bacterium JMAK1]